MSMIPTEVWLELQNREIDEINKSLEGERKNRAKREFVLVLTCLLALLYTYQLQDFQANPNIEIPAISLKVPLRDALAVFPTLIAAIYLVYLASAIGESLLMGRRVAYSKQMSEFERTGEVHPRDYGPGMYLGLRYLLLPTPLHRRAYALGAADITRTIVDVFVGLVFTVLPYVTMGFLLVKSWHLLHYKTILVWNSICMLMMLMAYVNALLNSKVPRRRWGF